MTNSVGSIGPFGYTLSPADVTRPISRVNALPQSASSLSFQVSVTANDPVGANGATPSGIASIDIFVATDQGAFQYWTTVAATSPVAQFTGQSNRTYWFYSIARDHLGNTEANTGIPHTYTFVGDFDAPLTAVVQVTVDDQTGLMQVNSASRDIGGSGLTTVEHWVSIDGGPAQLIATLPAGSPAADGFHYKSSVFQGLRDGTSHTYRFFSIGKDSRGNAELPPAESTSDVVLVKTFSVITQLLPVSIDVQRGASQRSFLRYVDITFNSDHQASLQQLIDSGRIRLERFALSASNPSPGTGTLVSLATAQLTVIGNRIQVDFGAQGIGGNRNANVGDGFYQFIFDTDGDTSYTDARFGFFRIFGDTNGDGTVNATDIALQRLYFGQSGNNLEGDVNGDGVVNSLDLQHVTRESRLNKRLNSDLFPYVND